MINSLKLRPKDLFKKQIKANQTNKCPSSGYKDNCIGIINHNNGRYEGNFKNNKKHGSGSYYFTNGDRFIVNYKNGDVISGSYTYKSGQRFTGKFTKKDHLHLVLKDMQENGKVINM